MIRRRNRSIGLAVALFASVLSARATTARAATTCRAGASADEAASSDSGRRLIPLCPVHGRVTGRARVANPEVEGPITGGKGSPTIAATAFDLATVGYSQQEFFLSGEASSFTNAGTLASDGRWRVAPAESAPYKTRLLVFRPIDAKKFDGTVFVEWLNVSGGLDSAPDWITAHTEMIREGAAWVGVSAQFVGVEGGSAILGQNSTGLKMADPERYGSLSHPGDSFSYDIYSQAGRAIQHPRGIDPLAGLRVEKVIAIGESQSAFRMVTYVDAIDPIAQVFDGFLIHSRGSGGAALSQSPQATINTPDVAHIRSDVRVPVLTFETESDVGRLGFFPDRQPDSGNFRLWEVAGTAHADTYTLKVGFNDLGDSPDAAKLIVTADPLPGFITCDRPVNSGPQHWVLNAAVAALSRWVNGGPAPAHAPRLEVDAGPPPAVVRDQYGNARGGIRTPWVDAPIASLSGEGQTGAAFCFLFGTTVPFDTATLASLYPTHEAYVAQVAASTDRALRAGFLRSPDASLIKAAAEESDIGR